MSGMVDNLLTKAFTQHRAFHSGLFPQTRGAKPVLVVADTFLSGSGIENEIVWYQCASQGLYTT